MALFTSEPQSPSLEQYPPLASQLEQLFATPLPPDLPAIFARTNYGHHESRLTPDEKLLAQYIVARRASFLRHLQSEHDPKSFLYIGSGIDQLPAYIFGKDNIVNTSLPGDAAHYFRWHEGETNIATDWQNFDKNIPGVFDLVYYHDIEPRVLLQGYREMISKTAKHGRLVLDMESSAQESWQQDMQPSLTLFSRDSSLSPVPLPAKFNDLLPTDPAVHKATSSLELRSVFPQQCFRVFNKA